MIRNKTVARVAAAAALAVGLLLAGPRAEAQSSVFSPGTRPGWFTMGLGPTIVLGGSNAPGGEAFFRINPQVGYHFTGRTEGPAIAGEINMLVRSNFFQMLFGGRFYYDIAIPNTGLLLAPNAGVGLGFVNVSVPFFGSSTNFALEIPIGFDVRFVLANRGLLFVRPVGINIEIIPTRTTTSVWVVYDLLFGGGVTF